MLILGIDTSTSYLSVALVESDDYDSEEIGSVQEKTQNNQSEILLSRIETLLNKHGYKPTDLEKIAVAIGPGSYTGVRVGVTVAKTLAYALNIPVTPMSSFIPMRYTPNHSDITVPMIDARRGTVFAAAFGLTLDEGYLIPEGHYEFEDFLAKVLKLGYEFSFVGDAAIVHKERLLSFATKERWIFVSDESESSVNKAESIARLSYFENEFPSVDCHELKPNYLRKTEAEMNLE